MANSSLKSTLAVSLNNYLDAGAIVAGASGITLWQNYLGLSEMHLGWLNAISANALGAAIGAIIGGFLADKFGRKFIFTYNLLVYMTGVLIVMLSVNFPMLLCGFLVTGISVGIGVPASWTYISESSEANNRGRNICISQMSWGFGPMLILLSPAATSITSLNPWHMPSLVPMPPQPQWRCSAPAWSSAHSSSWPS